MSIYLSLWIFPSINKVKHLKIALHRTPKPCHCRGRKAETQFQDGFQHGHPASSYNQVFHGSSILKHDSTTSGDAENFDNKEGTKYFQTKSNCFPSIYSLYIYILIFKQQLNGDVGPVSIGRWKMFWGICFWLQLKDFSIHKPFFHPLHSVVLEFKQINKL